MSFNKIYCVHHPNQNTEYFHHSRKYPPAPLQSPHLPPKYFQLVEQNLSKLGLIVVLQNCHPVSHLVVPLLIHSFFQYLQSLFCVTEIILGVGMR